jgi:hypothetical protein
VQRLRLEISGLEACHANQLLTKRILYGELALYQRHSLPLGPFDLNQDIRLPGPVFEAP